MGGLAKPVGTLANGPFGDFLNLGGMFGGSKEAAPAPVVAAPTPMPAPDDEAAKRARRRAAAAQQARGGRASTILTDAIGETLG